MTTANVNGMMWNKRKREVVNKKTKIDNMMIRKINEVEPEYENHNGTLRKKITVNDEWINPTNIMTHKNDVKDQLATWGEENKMKV